MSSSTVPPQQLPDAVRDYLAAHVAADTEATLRTFAPDAVVVDQDETYRGAEEIRRFLQEAGSEFTYTIELLGTDRVDDARWIARNRLEGNFPGGIAELSYRFTLGRGLITELVIGS